ncbi:MAG: hypothetical protein ABFS86_13370 [Planctomycetota bacterium]
MPDTFAGFIRFGRSFMGADGRQGPGADEFRRLLGRIGTVLGQAHGIVLERLREITGAADIAQARLVVEDLRGDALSRGFHAENLCDRFVQLGCDLDGLVQRMDGAPPETGIDHARDLVEQLKQREYRVAILYGETIDDLSGLLAGDDRAPLGDLQARARTAEREFTRQMEDFRDLAAEFGG